MKREMLTIWFLALALIFCSANVSEAAPMGTAFTYQGFLYDANSPADGEYDFEFTLYDANDAGSPVGSPVAKEDVDVFAGLFTVELDFGGGPFAGDARWLEIGVRPGDSSDSFTTLIPRQEITPTPYALYAESAGGASWNDLTEIPLGFADGTDDGLIAETDPTVAADVKDGVSWGELSSIPAGFADGTDDGITVETDPTVAADVKDGVSWGELSSIPAGFADGTDDIGGGDTDWTESAGNVYRVSGNVGIGTNSPGAKLDVNGDLKVTGAYKGNIGPNNGAPFPRPAYDSGWRSVSRNTTITLPHNIGGNVGNYVVDLQFQGGGSGIHNRFYGGINKPSGLHGASWYMLNATSIAVYRQTDDDVAGQIRIRIWVYN